MDIAGFDDCRVLVIGDLMIDEYVWGNVERVSPEAPVQVVSVRRDSVTLGGSGNVVNNLVALGAQVAVAGVIGAGANGDLLTRMFESRSVDVTALIRDPARQTTRKTRIIGGHQHVLRIDRETTQPISSDHHHRLIACLEDKLDCVDIVLISDYGKGLLTRALLRDVIDAVRRRKLPVIVDPKGLDFTKYAGATAITPNKREASLAAGIEVVDFETLTAVGTKLLQATAVETVLITCGKEDMVLFQPDTSPYRIPPRARQVFDVSGAGDTVLAVLGLAVATGHSFPEGAALANAAGGVVVGKVGTATVSREELQAAMNETTDFLTAKKRTMQDLVPLVDRYRAQGRTVVLTNGCFDLLHVGHVKFLAASRRMGDLLIVAVDDDASVQTLKGPGRPIIGAEQRLRIISALDSVDYVMLFSADQLESVIEALRPDILTKGSNYTCDQVLGKAAVERLGGQVVLIPITEEISSTGVIDQIRQGKGA